MEAVKNNPGYFSYTIDIRVINSHIIISLDDVCH